ncbi:FAD-dependent monooxygenase [Actinokineospora inagensis]|uniref:FAD-dependent monooxygenase n=1 Tax=Actinokineospora inagensis TaxID=103730 RepID=UPI0005509098|nr:FAD-dependent monooxygenase [Actinokineospora inagensis]
MRSVLISGASVAGPALAYWLGRHGFAVTVVERAEGPRRGGQAIDVRGAALSVVEWMGVRDAVAARSTDMRGMSFVDSEGTELHRSTEETLTGGRIDSPDIEILRDDLAEILLGIAPAEYVYGDTITAIEDRGDDVLVTFENAEPRGFDLVVGADGLHSRVRALAFGDEGDYIHHLGVYLAVFTMDNILGLDHWQTYYRTETVMAGIYSARANTEARGLLGFEGTDLGIDHRDLRAQRDELTKRFDGAGWKVQEMLDAMLVAPDFYFDSMAQIKMDRWSSGRVALVGDAGYCGSPMSGQGTSMALVGAYVLAGELSRTDDHAAAFAAYEAKMRPFVELNQTLVERMSEQEPNHEALQEAANGISLERYPTTR